MTSLGVGLFQGYGLDHEPFGLELAERASSSEVLKQSGVRHAAAYGLQVALLALAARAALAEVPSGVDPRRAVITNGGPWAAETTLGFLKAAEERGPQFVNPLVFPATLVSAGAAAVGMAVGAGAAAIAVGHDELAGFEMLRRARQLIAHGIADDVVLAAGCAHSSALAKTLRIAGRSAPIAECSVALRLSAARSTGWDFEDAFVGIDPRPWSDADHKTEVDIGADGLTAVGDLAIAPGHQLLSAAGLLLCAAALRKHDDVPRGKRLVVRVRHAGRIGAALFHKR